MLIFKEDGSLLENIEPFIDKKSALKRFKIETDNINLIGKSLNIKSYIKNMLLRYTCQNKLLGNKLSSFFKQIRFSK